MLSLTTSSYAPPYLNGMGGTAGTQTSISYYPDERRQKPKGLDLLRSGTAMAVEEVTERNPLHLKTVYSGDGWMTHQMGAHNAVNAGAYNIPDDWPLIAAQGQAYNELLKKVKSSRIDLGTALIETRSTATAVSDFARSVVNTLVQPRMKPALKFFRTYGTRRNFRKRWTPNQWDAYAKDLKDVRARESISAYFSYIYGLKPLMEDITNAVEGLQDLYMSESSQFKTLHVAKTVDTKETLVSPPESDYIYQKGGYIFGAAKATAKVRAYYRIDATSVKAASEFGITNPVSQVYNAIPYSFVLDWIVPVGDYLESLDSFTGVSEFLMIEGSIYTISSQASSGHQIDIVRKYRSAPSTTPPEFSFALTPSKHITNALNGILLLKQRY